MWKLTSRHVDNGAETKTSPLQVFVQCELRHLFPRHQRENNGFGFGPDARLSRDVPKVFRTRLWRGGVFASNALIGGAVFMTGFLSHVHTQGCLLGRFLPMGLSVVATRFMYVMYEDERRFVHVIYIYMKMMLGLVFLSCSL